MSSSQPSVSVVKRGGARPSEPFDPDKLHASVRAACLSVRSPDGEADMTALSVVKRVMEWCEAKSEITSHDLRRTASRHLEQFHPEAAYLYEQHPTII